MNVLVTCYADNLLKLRSLDKIHHTFVFKTRYNESTGKS